MMVSSHDDEGHSHAKYHLKFDEYIPLESEQVMRSYSTVMTGSKPQSIEQPSTSTSTSKRTQQQQQQLQQPEQSTPPPPPSTSRTTDPSTSSQTLKHPPPTPAS